MLQNRVCFASIDVEQDFGKEERNFKGVENLHKILDIFKSHRIPATLFVTGESLKNHRNLFLKWQANCEIACHAFTHRFWNGLDKEEREKEIENYLSLYQEVFGENPRGFRAPSHLIDNDGILLLQKKWFLYDSSVVPHYPPFKKYRGFKGKAPLSPYYPSLLNYRRKGDMSILEIPVSGQILGLPLAGAWIGRLPFLFYQFLFEAVRPAFITINMHSWDVLDFPGRKAPAAVFLKKLDKIISLLKEKHYTFLNGEQIFKNSR